MRGGEYRAWCLASLPLRMGGLGLRSSIRHAPAAYWASWADALSMIHARHPRFARNIVQSLSVNVPSLGGCLGELAVCKGLLEHEGFADIPSWQSLLEGAGPPSVVDSNVAPWERGWQHHSTRSAFVAYPARRRNNRVAIATCLQR